MLNKGLFLIAFICLHSFYSWSQQDSVTVHAFVISGNQKTKPQIITREITLIKGQRYASKEISEQIKQSELNLINTRLFNFATITPVPLDSSKIALRVVVEERWYVWPSPIFELAETNFNTWWLTKDFSRTNYGAFVNWKNFRGRNDQLYIKLRFGYSQEFRLSYEFPYINKKQNFGLGVSFDYFQQKEITYGTAENKRLFISDGDLNMRQEYQYKAQAFYRKNIFTQHLLEVRHTRTIVNDTVPELNRNYLLNSSTEAKYMSLIYRIKIDRRDVKAYPLKGYLIEGLFQKVGFGLFDNRFKELSYFQLAYKKYEHIKNRWFAGISLKQKISLYANEPYYTQRGLGYSDFVRGYEYYVIDAQQYSLIKSNIKFQLIKPRVKEFKFIKIKQFKKVPYAIYANAYADIAYAYDELYSEANQLANKWLIGVGVGIDFVTYYDKVVRLELSHNHLNEIGFFIHFKQPL